MAAELLHRRVHHGDRLDRNARLVEERQCIARVGQICFGHAPRVRGHCLAWLGLRRWHGEHFAQMHLGRVRFGRKALALVAKHLTLEPLQLVLQRRDRLRLGLDEMGQFCGT